MVISISEILCVIFYVLCLPFESFTRFISNKFFQNIVEEILPILFILFILSLHGSLFIFVNGSLLWLFDDVLYHFGIWWSCYFWFIAFIIVNALLPRFIFVLVIFNLTIFKLKFFFGIFILGWLLIIGWLFFMKVLLDMIILPDWVIWWHFSLWLQIETWFWSLKNLWVFDYFFYLATINRFIPCV